MYVCICMCDLLNNPCVSAGTVCNFQYKWEKAYGWGELLLRMHNTIPCWWELTGWNHRSECKSEGSIPISDYMISAPIQVCKIALKLREVRTCSYLLTCLNIMPHPSRDVHKPWPQINQSTGLLAHWLLSPHCSFTGQILWNLIIWDQVGWLGNGS